MKWTFLAIMLIFPVSLIFAADPPLMTPVTSVTLRYDLQNSTLHVEAVHPSANWEIDYVRMMTVSLNGQQVLTNNYYHQDNAQGFSDDVTLKAKAGDVISADVFCTNGSNMSQDLTVTDAQPQQETNASTDNSETNNTAY